MESTSNRSGARGFTMIELMVVVSIMAVLLAVAAPSFQGLLAAQRMRAVAYDMVGDLVLARSEALKRGADVSITPSATGWGGGWKVQVDSNSQLLDSRNHVGGGVTFTSSPASITFDRNGRVNSVNVIRFGLSDGGARKRCISLDPSGRPKSAITVCPS